MTLAEIAELPATLDDRQAAELVGVGYEAWTRAARAGQTPIVPIQVGRKRRWPTARLLELLGVEVDDGAG